MSRFLPLLLTLLPLYAFPVAAAPIPDPGARILAAARERWTKDGMPPTVVETGMPAADAKDLVRKRLHPALTKGMTSIAMIEYDVAGHQIDLLILTYATGKAEPAFKRAQSSGDHFRSKILTPFIPLHVGNQLVIAYSEQARNAETMAFLESLPGMFQPR